MSARKRTRRVWEYLNASANVKEKGKDVKNGRYKLCSVQLIDGCGTLHLLVKQAEVFD